MELRPTATTSRRVAAVVAIAWCAEDPTEGPDRVMRCAAEQVAQGQRAFFATQGRYFQGRCPDIAVGTLPEDVSCMLVGT
jgi:hypothetical protein